MTPTADASPDVSADILDVFAAEAEEHLATVGRALPLLRDDPESATHLQDIRRAVHTLKGSAASVGFAPLARLAHRAEDLLDAVADAGRPVTADELALLGRTQDGLEDLAAGRTADHAELFAQLAAAAAAVNPDATSTSTPAPEARPEPAAEPESVAAAAAAVRSEGEALRVPLARLDDVAKLVGELVISRAGFEQHLGRFGRLLADLRLSAERMRRASAKLDAHYEARALGGGRLVNRLNPGSAYGFDGLEFDRYTDFHLLTRELAETSTDVGTVAGELAALSAEFDSYLVRQSRLTGEVQDKLTRARTVPLAHLAPRLHRTVRHAATALGKDARLEIVGEGTGLDKAILEGVSEPLLHILRNAVDHGLESPEARAAAGKPAAGRVRVEAATEGTQVVVRVSDDGRGIDADAIRASAVARGLLGADVTATPDDLLDLLFRPGFSTAAEVTEVSGRGVGLDVVRTMVGRLKGTVAVSSTPGAGTTFTIRLPLTLAVVRALHVRAGGQLFAVPMAAVERLLRPDPDACDTVGGQAVVRVGDETIPRVSLAERLGLRPTEPTRPPAVVLRAGGEKWVVTVDEIVGGREVVVKSLGTHVKAAPGVAGATLTGDGAVVLILDPDGLFTVRRASPVAPVAPAPAAPAGGLSVLVVDDSPSVRRVVTGQLRDAGFGTASARDGLEALDHLHHASRLPDALLVDVEMPRMDGYELLATLRADPLFRELPVVMLTSRAGDKHRKKAAELGATAYLTKPYAPEELLRTLRAAARAAMATA